jgi:hypothetical protein
MQWLTELPVSDLSPTDQSSNRTLRRLQWLTQLAVSDLFPIDHFPRWPGMTLAAEHPRAFSSRQRPPWEQPGVDFLHLVDPRRLAPALLDPRQRTSGEPALPEQGSVAILTGL